jgi:mycothiol S-conjugate amidase
VSSNHSSPSEAQQTQPWPTDRNGERLSLLTVHAHPDDESSKGAGTLARYGDEGVYTTLVCCTGGEMGDIANPAMDLPEVKENLAAVRRDELAKATSVIGFSEVVMLGYRDSGMAGSEANNDPACFHQANRDEAVGRLVAIIRRVRPQVIITYSDDQQGYPHPDHLAVHEITGPAFAAAGDVTYRPDLGAPWQPLKLYYSAWARTRMMAFHTRFAEVGIKSPYDEKWFERPSADHRITTQVPIGPWYSRRCDALRAHATQIDPTSPFWFGLPDEDAAQTYPWDDFILSQSMLTEGPGSAAYLESIPTVEGQLRAVTEADLFDGIRPR